MGDLITTLIQVMSGVILAGIGLFLIKSDRYNVFLSILNLVFVIILFSFLYWVKVNNIILPIVSLLYVIFTKEYFFTAFLFIGFLTDVIMIEKNKKEIQENLYSVKIDDNILRDLYI